MDHHSRFLSSFLVITIFLCVASRAYSKESSIDEICRNHRDPQFCKAFLKDKAGSKVPFLAQHAIAKALDTAAVSKEKLESLGQKTGDPHLMETYNSCCEYYETAIQNLIEAAKFLEKGDFTRMNTTAMNALESLRACGSTIGPGFDPSLKRKHAELMSMEGVVFVCNYLLLGKKPETLQV